jgi:hypothetical protein
VQVIKELLQQVFVTPKGHQKSKPFFDHVISFSICDGRIWMRNYQVVTPADRRELKATGPTLVEVGPRLTLQPIKVHPSPPSSSLLLPSLVPFLQLSVPSTEIGHMFCQQL